MNGVWGGIRPPSVFTRSVIPATPEYDKEWRVGRDLWRDFCDEYVACDQWSAERVVIPSLHRDTEVRMKVRVLGRRGKGDRLRANRWSAYIQIGRRFIFGENVQKLRPCKSVSDALRQADAAFRKGEYNWAVRQEIARGYCPETSESWFRWDPEQGGWIPWFTWFPVAYLNELDLPAGHYFYTWWKSRFEMKGRFIRRNPHSSSSYWCDEGREVLEELGTWIPRPCADVCTSSQRGVTFLTTP